MPGAFALVALATGAFLPQQARPPRRRFPWPRTPARRTIRVQPAAPGQGVGRGGAIVLSNARLTAIEREDAPSQHDGTIRVIGTDEQGDLSPDRKLPPMRVSFLVIKWESDKEPIAAGRHSKPGHRPESGGRLRPQTGRSLHLGGPAPGRIGGARTRRKPADEVLYRRWAKGDPLEPHKVELVFEDKIFYELKEGDWVKKDQLVALVDPTVQVDDVAIKLNKLETAESEYKEAIKTKEEAQRRAQ